jgi:hypothetical protein
VQVSIGHELREAQWWQVDPLTEVDGEGVAKELAHKAAGQVPAVLRPYLLRLITLDQLPYVTVSILRRFWVKERGQVPFPFFLDL